MWWKSVRCELLELLGEGGQGRVFKALRSEKRSGLQQTVAIKILRSKNEVKNWRREFESLARVRSPYCVQVLSFERFQGKPALVLEFIDGVSLAQLGQACWLSEEEITELLAQIEGALKDLQRHGIFHGDLSPQNVLLDREGRVRVLDFGLANSCDGESRLTPAFAAPERLNGAPASASTDLYSLGRIEQFLRGTVAAPSIYIEARVFQNLTPCPERQKKLGEKVNDLITRRQLVAGARTKSHVLSSPPRRSTRARALILGGITSLLMLATSSASPIPHPLFASLNVRTKSWHFLTLDGRPVGYTPLSLVITAGAPHRLQWATANSRGERVITLKPEESRALEDSDFSH